MDVSTCVSSVISGISNMLGYVSTAACTNDVFVHAYSSAYTKDSFVQAYSAAYTNDAFVYASSVAYCLFGVN